VLNLSAEDWKSVSSVLTHINRPANCVLPPRNILLLCEAEKARLEFQVLTILAHSSHEQALQRRLVSVLMEGLAAFST